MRTELRNMGLSLLIAGALIGASASEALAGPNERGHHAGGGHGNGNHGGGHGHCGNGNHGGDRGGQQTDTKKAGNGAPAGARDAGRKESARSAKASPVALAQKGLASPPKLGQTEGKVELKVNPTLSNVSTRSYVPQPNPDPNPRPELMRTAERKGAGARDALVVRTKDSLVVRASKEQKQQAASLASAASKRSQALPSVGKGSLGVRNAAAGRAPSSSSASTARYNYSGHVDGPPGSGGGRHGGSRGDDIGSSGPVKKGGNLPEVIDDGSNIWNPETWVGQGSGSGSGTSDDGGRETGGGPLPAY